MSSQTCKLGLEKLAAGGKGPPPPMRQLRRERQCLTKHRITIFASYALY